MTLRLPAKLDEQFEALARARSTSKHALIIEAADRFLTTEAKTELVLGAIDEISADYADTIKRLEDA